MLDSPTTDTIPPEWWSREAFLSGDPPGGICPPVIDITGRPRFLFHGPFIALSPGLWRATVFLELCADAARRSLALQFGAEPDYTTKALPRGAPGRHAVQLDYRLSEPGVGQVRLWLTKPAFHGDIRLSGAKIERVSDIQTATDA